ncbi:MAG: recombinase family protein [Bacteroides sp.]|nr:recombinase family protein [Eubacterium sp.]MCM1417529.1 recombinase family protein [Roseburia sp.]MCM1462564.1 recombinase family protein [Bacteroides sp.]
MARKSRKNTVVVESVRSVTFNTALYIRLSVEDGHGRSNSIENQQLILNDYVCDKPEFRVCDTYIDNGLTGTNFDRPSFKRLLSDIERGKINCIIVKDLSRLGRNSIDTGYYIEQYFVQNKIRFVAVNDNYDNTDKDNAHNGIILPLKNMINEAYALDIGRKIKAQAHQAMLDGEYIGARAPFGYKKAPDDCHKLIIDEETAPIVRQIYDWAAEGVGVTSIVVRLNEMGAVTSSVYKGSTSERGKRYKQNEKWTAFSVTHVLENPVYTGDMVQGKSKTIDHKQHDTNPEDYIIVRDTHEAIISREIFERVQEIRAAVREEYKNKSVEPYTENVFKGKVFCPHCGKPLHRQRAKRKKTAYTYYLHCLSKSRISKNACIGVFIYENTVLDFVSSAIKDRLSALDIPFSESVIEDNTAALKKEKTSKLRELERVQGLIKGLYENLVSGVISNEDYKEFKIGYTKQADDLKGELERLDDKISCLERERKQRLEIKSTADCFKNDGQLTAELINRLIERIEISHDREIDITFRSDGKEDRR